MRKLEVEDCPHTYSSVEAIGARITNLFRIAVVAELHEGSPEDLFLSESGRGRKGTKRRKACIAKAEIHSPSK